MGQLSIYLTPFASDYSGVCSALFDLNAITAINDAGCCTSHYVYYDEPRWDDKVRPIFSTALRNVDCILGNDEKIINVITEASQNISGEMISVVGTPVPALIGMDMDGIACEIEFRTGKPAFGFNTTGFEYYDKGIFAAGKALIDRFAKKKEIVKGRVNILGITPLDFGNCGNDKLLEEILTENGFEIGCRFFMGITKEQIENCASAEINLAVSSSGLKLAKYLNKKFKTPYVTGFPIGKEGVELLKKKIELALNQNADPSCQKNEMSANDEKFSEGKLLKNQDEKKILVIEDQIIANSIRDSLKEKIPEGFEINVATFFDFDKEEASEGDIYFKEEADYLKLLKEEKFDIIISDPDILAVPGVEKIKRIEVVHPAVSSQLKWNETRLFDDEFIDDIAKRVCGF